MDFFKMSPKLNFKKMDKIILLPFKKPSDFQTLCTILRQIHHKYLELNLKQTIFGILCTKIFDKLHCVHPRIHSKSKERNLNAKSIKSCYISLYYIGSDLYFFSS